MEIIFMGGLGFDVDFEVVYIGRGSQFYKYNSRVPQGLHI